MPALQQHIIRREFLHIEVQGTESDGLALQRMLPGPCQSRLMAALEGMLDRIVVPDEHLTVDRIEIDAGVFTIGNLEQDLANVVSQALEKTLREQLAAGGPAGFSGARRRTAAQTVHEAFFHFLKTGILPWWFHLPAGQTLEQAVCACWQAEDGGAGPAHFAGALAEAVRSGPVRKRIVSQFSSSFVERLLASISAQEASALHEVLAGDGGAPSQGAVRRFLRQACEAALARAAAGQPASAATLVAGCWDALPDADRLDPALLGYIGRHSAWGLAIRDGIDGEGLPPAEYKGREIPVAASEGPNPVQPGGPPAHIDLVEGIHAAHAGVILLHPFLPRFFETLGIASGDRLVQPERALCLLHFLATGQRAAPEYELLLAKLLCDVPLEMPVESVLELSRAEEKEAAALLDAVIRHWDVLRDASADGLRGTFLTRPGRLSQRGDSYVLQVEAQSFDILLDQLPWGISAVQLPWMPRILWVEWR